MKFSAVPEFDREFKKLLKKFRTLNQDLGLLKKRILTKYPQGYPPVIFHIDNLRIQTEVFKVKHFRCRTLKHKGSRSGIRIIYAYFPKKQRIEFVEIYYKEKGDRECNRKRILKYYS